MEEFILYTRCENVCTHPIMGEQTSGPETCDTKKEDEADT